MIEDEEALPFAQRKAEDTPGRWLLARLGKRVLRPGGLGPADRGERVVHHGDGLLAREGGPARRGCR